MTNTLEEQAENCRQCGRTLFKGEGKFCHDGSALYAAEQRAEGQEPCQSFMANSITDCDAAIYDKVNCCPECERPNQFGQKEKPMKRYTLAITFDAASDALAKEVRMVALETFCNVPAERYALVRTHLRKDHNVKMSTRDPE